MKTLTFAIAVLVSMPAGAETFRCGKWIVAPDMSVGELLEKCGAPTQKAVEEVEVRGPTVTGSGSVRRGTSIVETWTYDRGSQFDMIVKIVDGEITSMERGE
jgi:Protein of unknown function (DUF2845)